MGRKNDDFRSNGVNMKEWITLRLINFYGVIALIIAAKLFLFDLTEQDNEFFWTLSWPVMVIVGFYFAEKIALNFGKVTRMTITKEKQDESGDENGSPI